MELKNKPYAKER